MLLHFVPVRVEIITIVQTENHALLNSLFYVI